MKLPAFLLEPETRGITDRDDLSANPVFARMVQKKPFLKAVYRDFYGEFRKWLAGSGRAEGGAVVELGSGHGFIKEMIPDAVTSDILPLEGMDRCFSALDMPFPVGSIRAFLLLNTFHHLPDARGFLREAFRCLKPGGRIIMIEPANTPWNRFIHRNFHHEPFDPRAGWTVSGNGPLTSANDALAWIVFTRDRARFEKEFPLLKIKSLRRHSPFRFLISGGVTLRPLLPAFAHRPLTWCETLLSPLAPLLAMYQTVVLEKGAAF